MAESEAIMMGNSSPPKVDVPGKDVPVPQISSDALKSIGYNLSHLFTQYRSDRRIQELRWLRNLRQYLGYYDPEVEKMLAPERSRAYPKITRVKVITMLAQILDLMFPSDDINWTLKARPSVDMAIKDVAQAIQDAQKLDQEAGNQVTVDEDYVTSAVQRLADKRAQDTSLLIKDQLEELGGDQSYDYVALNQEVILSAILYGLGLLAGPYARPVKTSSWTMGPQGQPVAKTRTSYMPQFEFVSVWEYYPDLAAKRLDKSDGYFLRKVMSRTALRALADKDTFFGDIIKNYLASHTIGNYRPQEFETELRAMGVKINVNETKIETTKYEVLVWHGKMDGNQLAAAGVDVDKDKLADQVEAEVWLLDGYVIRAAMNPWASLGIEVQTMHHFLFDKDDTAPIGFGLPNILRDTQMSISAGTRMLIDNASVIAGPMLEMNTALLRPDQDLGGIAAYKIWYRDDEGPTSQWPAVRDLNINGHLPDLKMIIDMFMSMADTETFVSPMNTGDIEQMPGEPLRTAAGASMLMGKASLPFKQIIRNYDRFTQSVIQSLVSFNRKFNPDKAEACEYDVIARGATSLIAKEVRGMQIDFLAGSLTPEERLHVDDRKFVEARFRVRDMEDMLVSEDEAARRKAAGDQQQQQQQQMLNDWSKANVRLVLAQAFKDLTQAQKNQVGADVAQVQAALDVLETGLEHAPSSHQDQQVLAAAAAQPNPAQPGQPAAPGGMPGAQQTPPADMTPLMQGNGLPGVS